MFDFKFHVTVILTAVRTNQFNRIVAEENKHYKGVYIYMYLYSYIHSYIDVDVCVYMLTCIFLCNVYFDYIAP